MYAVTASFIAGAIIGILYAPDEGANTRKKITKLKKKLSFGSDGLDEYDKETLQELSVAIRDQLEKIDRKLEE